MTCSACAGNYEDPERTAPESLEEAGAAIDDAPEADGAGDAFEEEPRPRRPRGERAAHAERTAAEGAHRLKPVLPGAAQPSGCVPWASVTSVAEAQASVTAALRADLAE